MPMKRLGFDENPSKSSSNLGRRVLSTESKFSHGIRSEQWKISSLLREAEKTNTTTRDQV
ncbi:hypothetical protein IFM47457_04889 [Aspergillus lentulus]|nr:hypothetical protein IFM47457_04889 [Aspergillus lentulus]